MPPWIFQDRVPPRGATATKCLLRAQKLYLHRCDICNDIRDCWYAAAPSTARWSPSSWLAISERSVQNGHLLPSEGFGCGQDMCGFTGFLSKIGSSDEAASIALLTRMGLAIRHRGPDSAAEWTDASSGIGLSHRRLAIVDLSEAGAQPMISTDGRYVFAFNGEIYNHVDLRRDLEAAGLHAEWRGHSDTETLLAGFVAWGVRETIERSVGMFAFALWDRQERTLTLGRDRAGEKPLYYGWQGNDFLFGSELKAMRQHPSFVGGVNRNVLALYLRHYYIPAPYSIHPGINKLLPGTLLAVSLKNPEPRLTPYWSGLEVARTSRREMFGGDASQAVDALDSLLQDAIGRQMMADVPLGAFLSGGVDSSAIVALMQVQSSQPVRTFSIGFNEARYNEAEHAKAVAKHLGTDHTELYVSPTDAFEVIPTLPEMYDEPFADSSQIPTALVSRMARRDVTVALSGDAGDELFCGYNRYLWADKIWRGFSPAPVALRRALSKGAMGISPDAWDRASDFLPRKFRPNNMGDKVHKLAEVLDARSSGDLYYSIISQWKDPVSAVPGSVEPPTPLTLGLDQLPELGAVERMMALDLISYVPDDNLAKVDRASMAVSLETRAPFLDHRVIEFAWRLPQDFKMRNGVTKWVLREVLHRYVPRALIERPKMGFAMPVDEWLRGELKDWASTLLDEDRLRSEGYFDPVVVGQRWREHLSGRRNWQHQLWPVLMFQAWLEHQHAREPGP